MARQGARWAKVFRHRLTILFVTHGGFPPIRWNVSLFLLLGGAVTWSAFTVWAGYVASQQIEYWRVKADHQLMKAKVWYFAKEVKRSRALLDQVREVEGELRKLLQMPSRQAIIERQEGTGGPSVADQLDLVRVLTGTVHEMGVPEIHRQITAVRQESFNALKSFEEVLQFINDQRSLFRATPNIWPALGRLTSRFGIRLSPFSLADGQEPGEPNAQLIGYDFHTGVDIANDRGTPVRAVADGVVTHAAWEGGYGRLVVLDHGHGFRTLYGHLGKVLFVKPGDRVTRGWCIAEMGSSGASTGPHLHYEVWRRGKRVNPLRYLQRTPSGREGQKPPGGS